MTSHTYFKHQGLPIMINTPKGDVYATHAKCLWAIRNNRLILIDGKNKATDKGISEPYWVIQLEVM